MKATAARIVRRTIRKLLKAAAKGDRQALAEYYALVSPGLQASLSIFLYTLGRPGWLDDLLQEVFTKVVTIIREAGAGGPVPDLSAPYLFTMGKNAALDWIRSERRTSETRKAEQDRQDAQGERRAEWRLAREQVVQILTLVPEKHHEFFRLIYVDGLSTTEAGNKVGIAEAAAYKREQRGLAHLKSIFKSNPHLATRIVGPV